MDVIGYHCAVTDIHAKKIQNLDVRLDDAKESSIRLGNGNTFSISATTLEKSDLDNGGISRRVLLRSIEIDEEGEVARTDNEGWQNPCVAPMGHFSNEDASDTCQPYFK